MGTLYQQGTTVTSDASGNILSDGTHTYTWNNGRRLATVTKNGTTWTNTYDANGMRTQRSSGSTSYIYSYDGTTLVQMTVGSNVLIFSYGINGQPMSVNYNGTDYYYVTNVQGDVIRILNSSGTVVVSYIYDAWGNIIYTTGSMATTLGAHNPLRYRGYVYDAETNLYYLKSRYYNPEACRFINADNYATTGQGLLGNNMFAYCGNDPVSFTDSSGTRREYVRDLAGVSKYVPVAGCSDGKMNSDVLLQYLKEQGAGNTGNTYHYTVQYVGIYTETTDYTDENVSFALGGVSLAVSFVPVVREVTWVAAACKIHSVLDFAYGGLNLFQEKTKTLAPNKEYHQYRVTLHYYEDTRYNGSTYRTIYDYELYYLWNDLKYSNPSWYLQKGINNSRSYYIG